MNRTSTGNLHICSRPFSSRVTGHQWLLAVTSDPAAKGLAKDMEVAGAGPVHCHFPLPPPPPPSFFTMCSSKRYLSFVSPWYIHHLNMEPATDTYMETHKEFEEEEVLDFRAQQSRLSSKQFVGTTWWKEKIVHSKAGRWTNCKAVPVGVQEKLNSQNGYAVTSRRQGKCCQM